jgi:hypothetical protein
LAATDNNRQSKRQKTADFARFNIPNAIKSPVSELAHLLLYVKSVALHIQPNPKELQNEIDENG